MSLGRSTSAVFALMLALHIGSATAQESSPPETSAGPLPGHSYHGEVFNEGPRQAARLMGGTGRVQFPISTQNADAQAFFLQGVGQLHGFWYFEAERSFRQAAMLDPDCAMAYWGMAMSNLDNPERGRKFIAEAVKRKDRATRKERLWIEAVDAYLADSGEETDRRKKFVEALEALVREYPDDLEPKAFLAVQIFKNAQKGIPISSRQAVESLIQEVLRVEPMHPIHHYRIHNWDNGDASVALSSAARCGQAAPSIAHMWHMPGHIYSKVHRFADAVWQQEASARVDHAYMIRDRILPDQIHNYAHNNEWLIRNLSHLGRVREAVAMAKNLIELPRHPKYNSLSKDGSCSAKFGRERLIEVLIRWEQWDELLALANTAYLEPTDIPLEQVRRLRAVGIAAFQSGRIDAGKAAIDELVAISLTARSQREQALVSAEQKVRDENKEAPEQDLNSRIEAARADAAKDADRLAEQIEASLTELRGLQALAAGDHPAAQDYFHRLTGVTRERLAGYFLKAGDVSRAEELAREAVDDAENQVPPLAILVEILEAAGKTEEAAESFTQLRSVAAHAELDTPVLARLHPVAQRLGMPPDWRLSPEPPNDVGERPELDTLGPLHWSPSAAPDWQLVDSEGISATLAEYRGQPVVVIFYLGFGCLHCTEQLQSFAAEANAFRQAGIEIVAISNESLPRLREGLANYSPEGEFPLRLLSDEALQAFRDYRVYDDFESAPLHGTFLIDGAGRVRWWDIAYEPFDDPHFLLREAVRLLDQSLSTTAGPQLSGVR